MRGKADCMLLAAGKMLLCHKALLSQRSPELRDMIIMETPTDTEESYPIQLLLPELRNDAAKAFLHYLYTDNLPNWVISNITLLNSLKMKRGMPDCNPMRRCCHRQT